MNTIVATGCLSSFSGSLGSHDGSGGGFPWTQFSYVYLANITQPYLSFGFEMGSHRQFYLDDVSVVDVNATNTQLLVNPGFENSTLTLTGWTVQTGCCNSNAAQVITSSCYSGSNCLVYFCGLANIFSFLGQSFTATVGHTYSISYYLKTSGTGNQPTICAVSVY